ncbi:MAG: RnfABCDGE type electron transport complex subunit G [Clostridia bacterium]|nr:RnfABCDGE type electron transport complex subunit G [Clostridia bacterium]
MQEIMKLGAKLLLICLVSASLLAVTNEMTKGPIQQQRDMASQAARQEVLATAEEFVPVDEATLAEIQSTYSTVVEAFVGKAGGADVGYVIKTTPGGFGGAVEVITGIDVDGKLTGVRIGSHNETPGLGGIITTEGFYGQYAGMVAGEIGVSKIAKSDTEIKAIAGATISSRAVTSGVNEAIGAYKALNN